MAHIVISQAVPLSYEPNLGGLLFGSFFFHSAGFHSHVDKPFDARLVTALRQQNLTSPVGDEPARAPNRISDDGNRSALKTFGHEPYLSSQRSSHTGPFS